MRYCEDCAKELELSFDPYPVHDMCDYCGKYKPCQAIACFEEDISMRKAGKIVIRRESKDESDIRTAFLDLFKSCPMPDEDIMSYLPVYIKRQDYTRMLLAHDLYQKILDVPGVILDLGCRWGTNMVMFTNLRGILEPYNWSRKIIGFDTFTGFLEPSDKDKSADGEELTEGMYRVPEGYEKYLESVINYHELECPIGHIEKHEIIKGDVKETLPDYLEDHPETVVSLAYFDMNEYEPTRAALEAIFPYISPGSVIVFDQLASRDYVGETLAAREMKWLQEFRLRRSPYSGHQAYLIVE